MTELEKALELLCKLVDIDECEYNNYDSCVAHGFHDRPCPHKEAKDLLDTHSVQWAPDNWRRDKKDD